MHSDIHFADAEYKIEDFRHSEARPFGSIFTIIKNAVIKSPDLYSPLSGIYQKENLQTVFAAYDLLIYQGLNISKEALIEGIANVTLNTGFKGRWTIKSNHPWIIFDTAHNEAGITEVMAQIHIMNFKKLHIVLGMVSDKDISKVLSLLPKKAVYYFCKPNIPRGLETDTLMLEAKKFDLVGKKFQSVKLAYQQAKKEANKNDLIFVGGSTFVVAEVI